jgi:hypothetical protein
LYWRATGRAFSGECSRALQTDKNKRTITRALNTDPNANATVGFSGKIKMMQRTDNAAA